MKTFVSVDEARATVLDHALCQPDDQIPYEESVGRTLAAPIVSEEPVPPFDISAMDGYDVRPQKMARVMRFRSGCTVLQRQMGLTGVVGGVRDDAGERFL